MSRYESELLRDAMLTAIPQSGHVFEAKEASDDELEAEYQEAAAMMTTEEQRRAEVDRARQFILKPQSPEDRKARLDKLKQRLPCTRCGQLGHWKDADESPVKVKVVNWEDPEEQVTEEIRPFPVTTFLSHGRENGAQLQAGSSILLMPAHWLGLAGLKRLKWS